MNDRFSKIVFEDTLQGVGEERLEGFLTHALCLDGCMDFDFNGNHFTFSKGDLLIVRKGNLMDNMRPSDDFKVRVLYVEAGYIEHCTPQSNYGMKGQLALFMNPVMHLTPRQFELCSKDFDSLEYRHETTRFPFYEEGLRCAMQLLIIDFFNFHAFLNGDNPITPQYAAIMDKFLSLLESGAYREHREVTYYASEICVSPKYLSEVCKKVSEHSANFWINRYTTLDISRQLRNRDLTFVQISDMFNFSSPAYFCRYVQHNLGMNPTDYR
ncbi:MAG: helix-turn-helix domain-containing protein [Muribaculum sp.]|nr:helix-turn-helix domain-containing protein [Muribaculum sp.]